MSTQVEIARKLGISQKTVSRVICGSRHVCPRTRKRVLAAIERSGYSLNLSARNLHNGRKGVVGITYLGYPPMHSSFFLPTFRGICREAESNHLAVLASSLEGPADNAAIASLASKTDGLIVFNLCERVQDGERVAKRLERLGSPVMTVQNFPSRRSLPRVAINNRLGGYRAGRHLLELKHTGIAFFGYRPDNAECRERLEGCLQACDEAGHPMRKEWVFYCPAEDLDAAVDSFFSLPKAGRPTAIFAWGDWNARVIVSLCERRGVRVPEDISVIGFDDFAPYSLTMHPYLTTIRQPLEEMGQEAMRRLVDLIEGKTVDSELLLEPVLVKRETCAPPAASRKAGKHGIAARQPGAGRRTAGNGRAQTVCRL